jgi:hypothetical protein
MRMLQKTEVEGTALTKVGDNMNQSPHASNASTLTHYHEMATKQQSFICALMNRKNTTLFSWKTILKT